MSIIDNEIRDLSDGNHETDTIQTRATRISMPQPLREVGGSIVNVPLSPMIQEMLDAELSEAAATTR